MSLAALRSGHILPLALVGVLMAIALAGCTSTGTGQERIFYVFTSIRDFNETAAGVPHDSFDPGLIIVNQGDSVTIHFYNTDEERHTFTIGAPYSINKDIEGGKSDTVQFVASQAGIFTYSCTLHGPTMFGQLVVQKA